MKIVLAGASGTGKSTLARYISEKYRLPYKENSAGGLFTEEDKKYLSRWGYNGNLGQLGVLKKCMEYPAFGEAFQYLVLKARLELAEYPEFVYDRSALDPAVFYIHQVVQDFPDDTGLNFLRQCMEVISMYDMILYLPVGCFDRPVQAVKIEENGSRCHSLWFQWKMGELFVSTYALLKSLNKTFRWVERLPKFYHIWLWEYEKRIALVDEVIKVNRLRLGR